MIMTEQIRDICPLLLDESGDRHSKLMSPENLESIKIKRPSVDLLIVGGHGEGKSATGNSILGRKEFFTGENDTLMTQHCQSGSTEIDGRVIKVVDTPGVLDAVFEFEEQTNSVFVKDISKGLEEFSQGFSAVLMVMSYRRELTVKQLQILKTLKQMFGYDVIRKYTVLVFTHGDKFKMDFENKNEEFIEWCQHHKGKALDVLQECRFRCVLFDNSTDNEVVQTVQLISLVSQIDYLRKGQDYFTNNLQITKTIFEKKVMYANIEREIKKTKNNLAQIVVLLEDEEQLPSLPQLKLETVNVKKSLERYINLQIPQVDILYVHAMHFEQLIDNKMSILDGKERTRTLTSKLNEGKDAACQYFYSKYREQLLSLFGGRCYDQLKTDKISGLQMAYDQFHFFSETSNTLLTLESQVCIDKRKQRLVSQDSFRKNIWNVLLFFSDGIVRAVFQLLSQ